MAQPKDTAEGRKAFKREYYHKNKEKARVYAKIYRVKEQRKVTRAIQAKDESTTPITKRRRRNTIRGTRQGGKSTTGTTSSPTETSLEITTKQIEQEQDFTIQQTIPSNKQVKEKRVPG
jgi:hypothetical protein